MKKRYPKMKYPWNIERSLDREINKFLNEYDKETRKMIEKELKPILETGEVITLTSLSRILAELRKKFGTILNEKTASKVIQKSIKSISTVNQAALENQLKVREVGSVSPIKSDTWLKEYTKVKIKENVSYIQGIADNYRDKVEQAVYRAVTQGSNLSDLREQVQKISEKSHNQASFIARDQTGTILGQINAKRQEQAGFPAFRWSDSGDNRVRPDHAERNGKIYFYKDNPKLPGEDYGCRCIAEPVDEYELEEIAGEENG